ncbi:MAG: hypothetical protein WCR67_04260 [Bacilli bacterium]
MIKLDDYLYKISDKRSSYYAGSGALLSLVPLMKSLENDLVGMDESFTETEKLIMKVIEEDGIFFTYSLSKEQLSDDQWNKVMEIIDDYTSLLDNLNQFLTVTELSQADVYIPMIKENFVFISHLAMMSLSSFYEMSAQPEEFFAKANAMLLAIRG